MLGEQGRLDQNGACLIKMPRETRHPLSKRMTVRQVSESTEQRDDQVEPMTE